MSPAFQGPELIPYFEAQLKEYLCFAHREINGHVLCYICTLPSSLALGAYERVEHIEGINSISTH